MSVYLHDIPLDEAKATFINALTTAGLKRILFKEYVPLNEKVVGRILAAPVYAKISSPHYHAAAMDGFAVKAESTNEAQPTMPKQLDLGDKNQAIMETIYVDTGDPIPQGFNAVIPIENTEPLTANRETSTDIRNPRYIRIRSGVPPWSNIRPLGEDIVATQLLFPAGHIVRPIDIGAIAAAGHTRIRVARKPRVAIIPTGSELVEIGSKLLPGAIIEFNSLILASMVNEWGGKARRYPITRDIFSEICERVIEASQDNDLILLNAGSSAGSEDFSAAVVEKFGKLLVHGIAIRPGHPVILGMLDGVMLEEQASKRSDPIKVKEKKWIPIIGVPGYPVSATLINELFVEPLLALWTGRLPMERPRELARITHKITSPPGNDDFIRVALGEVNNHLLAIPLSRGAGVISSLVQADGLLQVPSGIPGIDSGQFVEISLLRSKELIKKTILCIGSHDLTLDLLSRFLSTRERRLTSINVGSQGGLVAINKGDAHLAGSHLLDTETGQYNLSYIRKYIHGKKINVYGFVDRDQGLIVKKGNPKNIKDLWDISRTDVFYINRQRGAGTRVLLDYMLGNLGLSAEKIQGYDNEEYTHLNVAAAIVSGRADCGLGIPSAAQALGLDFIPITQEKFQLIIPEENINQEILIPLFDILTSNEFKKEVERMPGYKTEELGKLICTI